MIQKQKLMLAAPLVVLMIASVFAATVFYDFSYSKVGKFNMNNAQGKTTLVAKSSSPYFSLNFVGTLKNKPFTLVASIQNMKTVVSGKTTTVTGVVYYTYTGTSKLLFSNNAKVVSNANTGQTSVYIDNNLIVNKLD